MKRSGSRKLMSVLSALAAAVTMVFASGCSPEQVKEKILDTEGVKKAGNGFWQAVLNNDSATAKSYLLNEKYHKYMDKFCPFWHKNAAKVEFVSGNASNGTDAVVKYKLTTKKGKTRIYTLVMKKTDNGWKISKLLIPKKKTPNTVTPKKKAPENTEGTVKLPSSDDIKKRDAETDREIQKVLDDDSNWESTDKKSSNDSDDD